MAELSKRAQKTLARLKNGEFYPVDRKPLQSILELKRLGLIDRTGRVEIYRACYVPAEGYMPMTIEAFEDEGDNYKRALASNAGPELLEALKRQTDNMAFVINHVGLPDQWREKFTRELDEDRAAIAKAEGKSK